MNKQQDTESTTSSGVEVTPRERIEALVRQRWKRLWQEPLPSDDEQDQLLFVIGMIEGIVEALELTVSDEERGGLRLFAEELCQIDNDD